jgi:hypothetical protein
MNILIAVAVLLSALNFATVESSGPFTVATSWCVFGVALLYLIIRPLMKPLRYHIELRKDDQ